MIDNGNTDALVVTYRRPQELRRLIASLLQGHLVPRRIVVVDNSPAQEALEVCRSFGGICHHIAVGRNAGVGAGFNIGLRVLASDPPEFVCALDDDSVLAKETLQALVKALNSNSQVSFAAPLITDGSRNPAARPGFARKSDTAAFKSAGSWQDLQKLHGSPLFWATGVCLLYRYRDAVGAGSYREDFWVLGEDVEFTLRLSKASPGRLVGEEVAHLPPAKRSPSPMDDKVAYVKFLALITNLSYMTTRLSHARREVLSAPKVAARFLISAPRFLGATKLRDATRAVCIGAIRGRPAGDLSFKAAFRDRYISEF